MKMSAGTRQYVNGLELRTGIKESTQAIVAEMLKDNSQVIEKYMHVAANQEDYRKSVYNKVYGDKEFVRLFKTTVIRELHSVHNNLLNGPAWERNPSIALFRKMLSYNTTQDHFWDSVVDVVEKEHRLRNTPPETTEFIQYDEKSNKIPVIQELMTPMDRGIVDKFKVILRNSSNKSWTPLSKIFPECSAEETPYQLLRLVEFKRSDPYQRGYTSNAPHPAHAETIDLRILKHRTTDGEYGLLSILEKELADLFNLEGLRNYYVYLLGAKNPIKIQNVSIWHKGPIEKTFRIQLVYNYKKALTLYYQRREAGTLVTESTEEVA